MCGIAGYIGNFVNKLNTDIILNTIHHRGPDETGEFLLNEVFLGHKRLSIVDLASGQQPMIIGDCVIVFNGEIYNHHELRRALQNDGVSFETMSDTEVLLQLYIHKGYTFVDYIDGMFAFVIYNQKTEQLVMARDNLGIKPLYIWNDPEFGFGFSSEMSTIVELIKQTSGNQINFKEESLLHYLKFGHIGKDGLIDKVDFLPKGKLFMYDLKKSNLNFVRDIDFIDENESGSLKETLRKEIHLELQADVEVGVLLSGGIDSSLITALAAEVKKPIHTFSITFKNSKNVDESEYSREISEKFGTIHHEFEFEEDKLLEYIPALIEALDMPMYDPAMLPMLYLSDMTSKHVKVALSGDGGDELFAGYTHHRVEIYYRFFSFLRILIKPLYKVLGLTKVYDTLSSVLSRIDNGLNMHYDLNEGLDSRLLRKSDLCSMRYGLEIRVPFLSKRLYNYSLKENRSNYANLRFGKLPLRKLVAELVNKKIAFKKKQGFRIPLNKWMAFGELGTTVENTLRFDYLIPSGVLNNNKVIELLNDKEKNCQELFSIYLLNEWLRKSIK